MRFFANTSPQREKSEIIIAIYPCGSKNEWKIQEKFTGCQPTKIKDTYTRCNY